MPFKRKAQRRKFAQLLIEGKITDDQVNRAKDVRQVGHLGGRPGAVGAEICAAIAADRRSLSKGYRPDPARTAT